MKNINDLLTPCLILDEDKLSKNIKRIKSLCAKKKYNFRPHLKTAKCREITLEFAKNFGSRAMVSTIEEIENLKNLKVIITLGKVAFDNCLKIYKKKFMIQKKFEFKHGNKYLLPDNKVLIACYHPSPRNVNTKLVTTNMINQLLINAKKIAKF